MENTKRRPPMKKNVVAVLGLVAMLMLMASVACGESTPVPGLNQPPITIKITPDIVKDVKQTPAPNDSTPTNIEPTDPGAPVVVPPTDPATPSTSGPSMVETPAPIESVKVSVSDSNPPVYTLEITSGLPGGCVKFNGYEVAHEGESINVTVTNLEPAEPVPCTAIYAQYEGDVVLDGVFTPGDAYSVFVNGKLTNSFTARDPEGRKMAVAESPIERVEVVVSESDPPEYNLLVVSRLPLGSSCSKFNGYDLLRRGSGFIDVTVTHLEVTEIVPCTKDLPVVTNDIPLGTEFAAGESYKVIVNGEVTNSFVGRDPAGRAVVVKESPVESVELIILESFPPQYRIKVISTMSGSSCSQFNGYDISRPFANDIQVKVTYLAPAGIVPCTADVAYAETDIPLDSNFNSKEEYTVVVNKMTETFIAQ
jgi:hypothetical protein